MAVYLDKRVRHSRFSAAFLQQAAALALEAAGVGGAELSLSLVGPRTMAGLNRQYRGKTGPTDVLSFAQDEGEEVVSPVAVLGDVVICEAVLREQAKTYGVTDTEELVRLLVHGVLHLLGYDHQEPRAAAAMQRKAARLEKTVLAGLSDPVRQP